MKRWTSALSMTCVVVTMTLTVALSGAAQGAAQRGKITELFTPPVSVSLEADTGLQCHALNVSKKPLTMTIEFLNGATGEVVGEPVTTTVEPLHSIENTVVFEAPVDAAYCRITVEGPKDAVRGGMCIAGGIFKVHCFSAPVLAQ